MELFFLGILILVLGAFFSLFCCESIKVKIVSVFSCISSLIILLSLPFSYQADFYIPLFGNIVFKSDLLSSFFVLVISLITAIISIYAIGYLEPYQNKGKKLSSHCFFLPILTATMLLVVTCQNALMFLILWELMSLSSFFLVIFEDDKKEVISAGIKYLIYMHISVVFIIAAFIVMSNYSGDYDFNSFKYIFMHYPYLKNIVFLLAFIGFGTKAGFFPMHNWLPDAHPAAPSHVSAVMSAVMIKTGIYGILRILQLIGTPTKIMGYTILFISVITALYGIIYAVNQKDIKKLLAYSSVENIGIIGIAISTIIFGQIYVNNLVIMLGVAGCFLHILNHSIFKSLLFMGVGSVYLKTHTKNIELLGGLIKKMPFTALFFLFGSIAICAFPPLNGFISEFLIYIGLLNMLKLNSSTLFIPVILTIGVLALVGTLVILAMSKLYSIIFLGKARSEHIDKVDYDVPQTMLIPMGILSGLTIVIGISSAFIVNIIPFSAFEIPVLVRYEYLYIFLQLTIISLIVLVFCLFIVISLYLRFMFLKKSQTYQTWSCGYNKGNNHIQYTASSFVSPFTSILTPLFKKIFDVKKPKGLFPKDAHYTSTVEDVEEAYIINPLLKFDEKLLTKFERLQDGNIQHYILYGLIFLILILIGVVIIG